MGYLQIPTSSLASFSKAVISIWFRIPAATLAAVTALPDDPGGDSFGDGWEGACFSPPLYKMIPLLTFGSLETGIGDAVGASIQPSFIGVDCSFAAPPTLAVNLQTATLCSYSKTPQDSSGEQRPECYFMAGFGSEPYSGLSSQVLEVTADAWHHALISFDIGHGCSITWANTDRSGTDGPYSFTAASTFSWAFDDVAKTGFSLSPSSANVYTYAAPGSTAPPIARLASNLIIPQGLFSGAKTAGDVTLPLVTPTDFTITVASSVIGSSGNPIGLPTSAAFVSNVYKIELAELQIFTGVTLDTSVEDNRRAFITTEGGPANMSLAETLLGQAPDIKLHGSNNWVTGANTGSLGTTFEPTGTITAYTPNPGD